MYVECRYGAASDTDLDSLLSAYSERLVVAGESEGIARVTNGSDEAVYSAHVRRDDELYGLIVKALRPIQIAEGNVRKVILAAVGYEKGPVARIVDEISLVLNIECTGAASDRDRENIAEPLCKIMRDVNCGDF